MSLEKRGVDVALELRAFTAGTAKRMDLGWELTAFVAGKGSWWMSRRELTVGAVRKGRGLDCEQRIDGSRPRTCDVGIDGRWRPEKRNG